MDVTHKLTNVQVPRPKKIRDYIAILLDASGSMAGNADRAYQVLRDQFENIGKLQEDTSREVYLNYYTFNSQVHYHVTNTRGKVNVPARSHYLPSGNTALLDAIAQATADLSAYDLNDGSDTSFLVVVITDGEENRSQKATWFSAKNLVETKTSRGNWTYVLLGPSGARDYAKQLGIPEGNVEIWDATRATEYSRISYATSSATSTYSQDRKLGVRSSANFFSPDLTKVDLRHLDDVTASYRRWVVDRECDIAPFVQVKTNSAYVPGTAFYPLTKTEKVNNDRAIVLYDKTTKRLLGSPYTHVTRAALGLSTGVGEATTRIKPGNHDKYEIYIESRSSNRKLVRGTSVLVKR